MYIEIIADVIFAFFAVFGAYAMMRLILTRLAPFSRFSLIFEVERSISAGEVPLLCGWIRDQLFLRGRVHLIAALSREQMKDEALVAAFCREGVEVKELG